MPVKQVNISSSKNIITPEQIEKICENTYLGLNRYFDDSEIYNIFMDTNHKNIFNNNPILELLDIMSNPDYFYYTCKWLFNIKLLPFQVAILKQLWLKKFPMFVAARGAGKTFLLAIYAMLRAIFTPNAKIIIVAAGFRQAKFMFEYMENIWRNSPILRQIVGQGKKEGPRRDIDRCNFYIGNSEIIAIPLGDGQKIRGLRSNYTLVDEFHAISQEIYEVVIKGFSSVSAAPEVRVYNTSNIKVLKSLGMLNEAENLEENLGFGNQIIISGTAYYHFNHFYEYWQRYKSIIESKGNKNKLQEIFKGEIPEGFDWTQYAVIRLPYNLLPDGFMDIQQIYQAKATNTNLSYIMEYGACEKRGTPIITNKGIVAIEDINIGDLVLTHKGRFKPVINKTYRQYNGKVNQYKTLYFNQDITTTCDHLFWYGEENFEKLNNKNTYLVHLSELYNIKNINLEEYCKNYLLTYNNNFIYSKSSQSKLDSIAQNDIRYNKNKIKDLMIKYNMTFGGICCVKYNKNIPKGSIPKKIDLSYDFGLIIGYYAAEGSSGANGRCISFALDEHKDTQFQKQLLEAIYNVFNITAKNYVRNNNISNITINNRLITEIIKNICPGISSTKLINHKILYSNKDFLRGVIEGYWNGDGHINDKFAVVECVNINLLSQIRLALSYFGISSSLNYCNMEKIKKRNNSLSNNLQQQYRLVITGKSFRKFLKTIYNKESCIVQPNSRIINTDKYTILPIIKKEVIDFNDIVYNLEVQDDFSYSKPNATVHNCFSSDSNGFFKRSLIESCVTKNPINLPSGPVTFSASISGNKKCKYVYGIDPASEADNFAITVLECHPDHRRIVYVWSITRSKMRERLNKMDAGQDYSFYNYCARKIRDLMKVFPTEHIGIDSQGGGVAVMEALHDKTQLENNELPLWPYIKQTYDNFWWEKEDKPTDREPGLHILHMINFASAEFTVEANHGMRKDFESKILLFPFFDSVTIAESIELDKLQKRTYDTLEDCCLDIEELKDELATIIHDQTTGGRDRWSTPEIKLPGNKKGKLRKDRYTSLLIANMIARTLSFDDKTPDYNCIGTYVGSKKGDTKNNSNMYVGRPDIASKLNAFHGKIVKRVGV